MTQAIREVAARLLAERLPDRPLRIRLLGVGVSSFETAGPRQQTLFPDAGRAAQGRLDQTVDQIRERFGREAVARAIKLRRSE